MSQKKLERLYRRGNIFYFRAIVPKPWRTRIKTFEIKFSLATADRCLATIRCRAISNAFDIFFMEKNLSSTPIGQVNDIAKAYFQACLNKALELSIDIPDDSHLDIDFEIAGCHERIAQLKTMLKTQKYDMIIKLDTDEALAGIKNLKSNPDTLAYARRLIAQAKVLQNEYLAQTLSGNTYNGALNDPIFKGMMPTAMPDFDENTTPPSRTLALSIDEYITFKKTTWATKTVADQKRSLYLVRDVLGPDRLLSSIISQDIRSIRDIIMKVPKNALKSKENMGKSLLEVIQTSTAAITLTFKTQDKYFSMIRSFFKWAVDEELIPTMPGPNIKILDTAKMSAMEERYPYSTEQLSKIISSPLYTGSKSSSRRTTSGDYFVKDGYFWIPLIALYSGMRLGEIVQLRVDDVKSEDDIFYFDICLDDDNDKSLKTSSSIRRVPLHPKLISLGFLDHLRASQKAGKKRIFDDIKPSTTGYYSANFSKWWGRYARNTGIALPKTTFHSFRHNFIDALRNAEVPEDINRHLDGHSISNKKDAHVNYGSKPNLKRLLNGIEKVSYSQLEDQLKKLNLFM